MKAAIAGGAGRQCLATIYDFVEAKDVEKILLIDIDENALKERLKLVDSSKIAYKVIDLKDTNELAKALTGYDVVLNASSHTFNLDVMDACLISRTHYTDLGGFFYWARKQLAKHEDFQKAGITGIVGSGSAPGIVNVMAKYAADRLDTIDTILMLDGIINRSEGGYNFIPPYALDTLIDEFSSNNIEYVNGEFVENPPFSGKLTTTFPEPYGEMNLYSMIHSEIATMPLAFKDKGIKNVVFKLALPKMFEDRLRFMLENGMGKREPISIKGVSISPRDFMMAVFEKRGVPMKSKTPDDMKFLKVIVTGEKNNRKITYEIETDLHHHPWGLSNGHFSVGFPAAITSRMLGNGWVKEKGFYSGENVLDTEIYFRELARRGIKVTAKAIEGI